VNDSSEDDRVALCRELSELFGGRVSIERHTSYSGEYGADLIDMTLVRSRESRPSYRKPRTALVVRGQPWQVPQVSLWPRTAGLIGRLRDSLSTFATLDFPDTPGFNAAYRVHAWNEPAGRMLVTRRLRNHLSAHRGWSLRGDRTCIAVFQERRIVAEADRAAFVDQATEIRKSTALGNTR